MSLKLSPLRLTGEADTRPLVISGPCSAETEAQVMATATALKNNGIYMLRAGIWKPRTKPGGFEGVGAEGLAWLQRAKAELGMKISTEVATPKHVEDSLAAGLDMLWVGARTAANPFAMQDLADSLRGVDIPVLVKNPVNPDIELWIGALERLNNAGITRLGAIHRGFSSADKSMYRNSPIWHLAIELRRRHPALPIIGDPSHIGGRRELIAPLCQQMMDIGFEGLIVETHCSPDEAWSDAAQQITPDVLQFILDRLVLRSTPQQSESLSALRRQVDQCDEELLELLAKRMRVCREIGAYKKENNLNVLQTGRYSEILDKRGAQGVLCGMSAPFVKAVFEAIHEESVRQQLEILNK
ncbi:MAG: bifunctional 3-deoxy-7-phosphoheptulonate synthase/chorismate mutase type II [Bacteroidales bacterium]|nr:bifunctional 3-deoxy-7-phosphoheptulonate synthase/chorismate mutase type II [Bacteroidales bacterium]